MVPQAVTMQVPVIHHAQAVIQDAAEVVVTVVLGIKKDEAPQVILKRVFWREG